MMQIPLKPSYLLAIFILLTHIGSGICVLFLPFPWWLIVFLISIISISCYYHLNNYVFLRFKKSPYQLILFKPTSNTWELHHRDQTISEASLLKNSFIFKRIIILSFKLKHRRNIFPVVLCQDALKQNIWRELRVYLIHCFPSIK